VFAALNNRPEVIRKLIKTPAMAFAYSITTGEMARKIEKVYEDKIGYDTELVWGKLLFLARVVQAECKRELKRPAAALAYMRQIARECNKRGDFVQYISPSGVPCCHRYQVSVPKKVYVGPDEYVCPAVDAKPGPRKRKTLNVVAANFVHSLDASHLVRSVNEAVIQHGMDILTVHDCFAVLAPNVPRLGQILRAQMALMYVAWGRR
jgi:DNA-directed RNA polymerase